MYAFRNNNRSRSRSKSRNSRFFNAVGKQKIESGRVQIKSIQINDVFYLLTLTLLFLLYIIKS